MVNQAVESAARNAAQRSIIAQPQPDPPSYVQHSVQRALDRNAEKGAPALWALLLMAIALFVSAAVGQQPVVVANPATAAQVRWVDFAVPLVEGDQPQPMLLGGLLALPGPEVGRHSRLWHLQADLKPGEVRRLSEWRPTAWKTATDAFPLLSKTHEQLMTLVPWLVVEDSGSRIEAQCTGARVVANDAARMTWRLELHTKGWHLIVWQTTWAWQDAIDVAGYVCWSDPTSPAWAKEGVSVSVRWGVPVSLYGARRQGLSMPDAADPSLWHLWSGRVPDAVGLPFRGVLMPPAGDERRDDLLAAAAQSALVASAVWPEGSWLGFGTRPAVAPVSRAGHDAWLEGSGDLVGARPGASALETGSTGAQAPFGAQKGVAAAGGDPWALRELLWAADDGLLRCGHHLELDGRPVTRASHPRWETWSLATERNAGDTLGKSRSQPWGWDKIGARQVGIDDQHDGTGPQYAAIALTGDLMLLDDAQLRFNAGEARAKSWRGGVDAPRAGGRLWQAWAKLALLVDEPTRARIKATSLRELDQRIEAWPAGGPARWDWTVLDDRVLPGFTAAVPWNSALCVLGSLEQARTWERLGDAATAARFFAFSKELGTVIVEFGMLRSTDGLWTPCTGVRAFPGGAAPPEGYYVFPRAGASYSPTPGIDLMVGTNGWFDWMTGPLFAADSPRSRAIIEAMRPVAGASTSSVEWWAAR